jgi:hypothetical protein
MRVAGDPRAESMHYSAAMLEPWILAAQLALCAALPAPHGLDSTLAAHTKGDAALDTLAARYGFVGGERERTALEKAIEAVVEHMNLFVRDIARSRLRDTNRVASSLVIQRDGPRITVSLDDRTYSAELGGAPVTVRGSTGDSLRLTHRLHGQRLVQTFEGERGSRINTFYVDGEGRLRLDVVVRSPQLPRDLLYRLSYGKRS